MIVLVDDNSAHRLLIKRAIRRLYPDQIVSELGSKNEALKFLTEKHEVSLFVIDMNLGDGKGTEIVIEIRKHLFTAPVLILSTSKLPEDIEAAKKAGANSYAVKDDNPEIFLQSVSAEVRALLDKPSLSRS